ncbi:serine aminopeptidase domain-containing protein [Hydrogenophaga sp. BPS33]|uniref:serine aminopeptidase domain-containing protein n=1 Tax=Hydrogenophaga sp. BPS33 TaxID=2651974 RepID=UPI0013582064|nr:alpha/beta hydrolase [Hydrogenophaga sp. BPS33]
MNPIRFGPRERQLYGVFHPANPQRPTGRGVLLCNPFGQEAVRLHRLYRVLADRLSHHGTHVMRFDYFGTGESSGADEDGELGGWCGDLLMADAELRKRSGCSSVSWVGARLGATLAALASANASRSIDNLVLWEPILQGDAYLQELEEADNQFLNHVLKRPGKPIAPFTEYMGFSVSPRLVEQIRQIDTAPLSTLRARRAVVMHTPVALRQPALASVMARAVPACESVPFEHAFDWTSEEALNTALVPAEALKLLQSLIDGVEP